MPVQRENGRIVVSRPFAELPAEDRLQRMQDALAELQDREKQRDPDYRPGQEIPRPSLRAERERL